VQLSEQRPQLALRADRGHAVEVRVERRGPEALDGPFIHARHEVVADLLLGRVPPRGLLRELVEDAPEESLVVLAELAEHVPARLVRRQRVVLDPAAARVLVEIHARIGVAIHGVHVEARCVRERGERRFLGRHGAGGEENREQEHAHVQ
jgi:hypothetical protein